MVSTEEIAEFHAQHKQPNVLVERRVTWADQGGSKLLYYFHMKVIKHFERDEGDFNIEVDVSCRPDHRLNPLTGVEGVDRMIYSFLPYSPCVGYLRGRLLSRRTVREFAPEQLSNLLRNPPLREALEREDNVGGYLSVDELEIRPDHHRSVKTLDLQMVHHLLVFLEADHLNTEISVQVTHPYGLEDCGWIVCVIPRRQKYTSHSTSSIMRRWTHGDHVQDDERTRSRRSSRIRHFSRMGFLEAGHEPTGTDATTSRNSEHDGNLSFMYTTMDMYRQNLPPFDGLDGLRQVYEVTELPSWSKNRHQASARDVC